MEHWTLYQAVVGRPTTIKRWRAPREERNNILFKTATAVLLDRSTFVAVTIVLAAAIVVVIYRSATSDGVVADKVNVIVSVGGMMAGILAIIIAKIRDNDNNKRHRETVAAINGAAERQIEVMTKLVAAINGVAELRDETLTTTIKDAVRDVVREELTVTRSTAEPNREAMRESQWPDH